MVVRHAESVSSAKPDETGGKPKIVSGVSDCDVQVCHSIQVIF
jgi:hypothetical protein